LDHAATTPVRAAVIERMTEAMKHHGANPASSHGPGRDAAAVVDRAAAEVAACIGACGDEIVWTSGATEAINLALKGVCGFHGGGHVISVVTEHSATLDTLDWMERGGVAVTRLAMDRDGLLDLAALAAALRADTRCVSVMHVNNETGVMQDLAAIGALCAEHGVTLHVDAAQSLGKQRIDVDAQHIGLLSMSAHKLGGPPGAGALYVRARPRIGLAAQIHRGGQQGNRRAGTLAVQQIAGSGAAGALLHTEGAALPQRLRRLNDRLWQGLAPIEGIVRNSPADGAAHILNVSVPGVHGAALLTGLNEGQPPLAVSSGATCSAARAESSHVLRAMGRRPALAAASGGLSLGADTTADTVDRAAQRMVAEVSRLRRLAPRRNAIPA